MYAMANRSMYIIHTYMICKKVQGRNPYNIFVAILVQTITPKRHFKINWPLAASRALRVSWSPIPVTSLTLLACKIQAQRKIKKFGGTEVLEGPLSKKVFLLKTVAFIAGKSENPAAQNFLFVFHW